VTGTLRPGLLTGLPAIGWAALAVLIALLAATQPLGVLAIGLGLACFGLLALITPLAALAILLILAPLRVLIATESSVRLPLDIGQIALLALVGAWIAASIARDRALPRLKWSPVYVPLLVFFAATTASSFSAFSMGAWLNEWLKWAQILLLVALCLNAGAHWEWLLFALALAGAGNALIGIYQFFGGSGALHLLINDRFFRAFGTFGQPNPFGGFMGLLAPLMLMAALGCGLRVWRRVNLSALTGLLFYGACTALVTAGVFLSWSRGAWLAFGLSVLVMVIALPRKFWQGAALVAVVAGLGAVLWLSGRLPASIVERINSATQETFAFNDVRGVHITPENYALVERFAHWQAALNMATAHPWLGVGFGNYEIAYPAHSLMNWELALGHAHNYYLNVLAETGMIGLAAYLVLWVGIVMLTWRSRRHPDPFARLIAVGLLGTWTYLGVHSLTDNLYVNNLFLHLGVMFGILAVLAAQARVRIA
jgi:putative inorganic carbon (hco3(-)) transporter